MTVGSRQLYPHDYPRASPPVTTASLSIAFQAIPLMFQVATASLSIAITSLRSVGPRDKSPGYSPHVTGVSVVVKITSACLPTACHRQVKFENLDKKIKAQG